MGARRVGLSLIVPFDLGADPVGEAACVPSPAVGVVVGVLVGLVDFAQVEADVVEQGLGRDGVDSPPVAVGLGVLVLGELGGEPIDLGLELVRVAHSSASSG